MKESIIHITVPPGKKKERIDRFLAHQIENVSRSKVQQAIKENLVTIDGKPVKANHIVIPGEVITVSLPRPPAPKAIPEPIPINIVYEDDTIIVVNKPAGMVTHPAYGNYTGTLVNALLYYLENKSSKEKREQLASTNAPLRPGIIHRLDKDTSGIIVVAKTEQAHHFLANQFSRRTIEREYWAVVWGNFKEKIGIIEAPLGRSKSDRKKIAVREDGKPAVTAYEVLEEFEGLSLLRLKLKTGRTHQIRVHLASVHHPVFGDPTYGGKRIVYGSVSSKRKAFINELFGLLNRQALHAKTLGFIHPISNEKVFFDSDLPNDISEVLRRLREY